MIRFFKILILFIFTFHELYSFPDGLDTIKFYNSKDLVNIGKDIYYFVDSSSRLSINDIIYDSSINFIHSSYRFLNFGITGYTYWIKFSILNQSDDKNLILDIAYPTIDSIDLFYVNNGLIHKISKGQYNFKDSQVPGYNVPDFLFSLPNSGFNTFYVRFRSYKQLQLPIFVGSNYSVLNQISLRNLIFGIYVGIIFIMIFYNLFIYIATLDDNYLFYVIYIFFVGLTQVTLNGYGNLFIWPYSRYLSMNCDFIVPILNGYAAILFIMNF